jgi:DNA-binding LytR/AlgR family response regulator
MTVQLTGTLERSASPGPQALLRRLSAPLPATQFLAALAATVAIATLYCQLWCLVAFPPANRMPMPIEASLAWSFSSVAPWVVGFELAKRRSEIARSRAGRGLAVAVIFAFAAFMSIVLELGLDTVIGVRETRPLSLQLAAQLPAVLLTVMALALTAFVLRQAVAKETASSDALAGVLARVDEIEWIEAAGNYVEVHGGGRASLHRVTMREVEGALDPKTFVRIHRSAIVNASHIAARLSIGGTPGVRLRDGTILKIGSRYAASLM